jgi:hypothetical protein
MPGRCSGGGAGEEQPLARPYGPDGARRRAQGNTDAFRHAELLEAYERLANVSDVLVCDRHGGTSASDQAGSHLGVLLDHPSIGFIDVGVWLARTHRYLLIAATRS